MRPSPAAGSSGARASDAAGPACGGHQLLSEQQRSVEPSPRRAPRSPGGPPAAAPSPAAGARMPPPPPPPPLQQHQHQQHQHRAPLNLAILEVREKKNAVAARARRREIARPISFSFFIGPSGTGRPRPRAREGGVRDGGATFIKLYCTRSLAVSFWLALARSRLRAVLARPLALRACVFLAAFLFLCRPPHPSSSRPLVCPRAGSGSLSLGCGCPSCGLPLARCTRWAFLGSRGAQAPLRLSFMLDVLSRSSRLSVA